MSQDEKSAIFPKEKELRGRLNLQTPVEIVPVRKRSDALPGHCYPNVERQIAEKGGSMVCGWRIHEVPGLFVEAEFHAVWRSPSGELVDVTGSEDGAASCIFIPDYGKAKPTTRVSPVQVAILEHPKMSEFFRVQAEFRAEKEKQLGENMSGVINWTGKMISLDLRSQQLAAELMAIRQRRAGKVL